MTFRSLFIHVALPALLFSACAVEPPQEPRGLGALKADHLLGSCEQDDCGSSAANGSGWCDESCGSFGDCASGAFARCGVAECELSADGCGSVCVDSQCFDSGVPVGQQNVECLVTDQGSTIGCGTRFCIQGAVPSENTCAEPGPTLPTPVECLITDTGEVLGCSAGETCAEVVIDCDTAEICEDCPPLCLKDKCV